MKSIMALIVTLCIIASTAGYVKAISYGYNGEPYMYTEDQPFGVQETNPSGFYPSTRNILPTGNQNFNKEQAPVIVPRTLFQVPPRERTAIGVRIKKLEFDPIPVYYG